MEKAKISYSILNGQSICLEELKDLGDQVLMKNGIFSSKIKIEHVSPNGLTIRLQNAADTHYLPYPFIFSPSRKVCFDHLLKFPKKKTTVIEGFSQAGKSNFACHLALIYRMPAQNFAVMYIGNIGEFNQNPYKYLKNELFYWFYEEIQKNLMAQTIISYFLKSKDQIFIFKNTIEFLSNLCENTEKKRILIVDQYNKFLLKSALLDNILRILISASQYQIYVSTNTDKQITIFTSEDSTDRDLLVLDETMKPIKEHEMKKVIKKLFNNDSNDFSQWLFSETQGNWNLIFFFHKYCANKRILTENFNIFTEYENFAEEYSSENQSKHKTWVIQNQYLKEIAGQKEKLQEMMMNLDLNQSYEFERDLLDTRYVFKTEDNCLKSINPIISKMLRRMYWNTNDIEKFLNNHGHLISGSAFGFIFEHYIIEKIKELNRKESFLLPIYINDEHFSLVCKEMGYVKYGKKYSLDNESTKNGYMCITYMKKQKKNEKSSVLYAAGQENFPLFDFLLDNNDDFKDMWNVTLNSKFFNKKLDHVHTYFSEYEEQTKNQLSK